ncbi:MAG: DUF1304 domain-containing protein [Gordonia sp. (in: high G+C Gram-positive bacteria)]
MIVAGFVLTGIAALVHIYIFYMESAAWTTSYVRTTFGLTERQAEATKEMAFNQGFYNLFLAVMVIVGIAAYAAGSTPVAAALVFAGAGSMVGAALVLLASSPDKRAAALKQGVVPLLGVLALGVGLVV